MAVFSLDNDELYLEEKRKIEEMIEKGLFKNIVQSQSSPDQNEASKEDESQIKEPEQKKLFKVTLSSFESAKKLTVIKEIRALLGLGLKEAKDIVEAAPSLLLDSAPSEKVDHIKAKLESIGCQINLE